MIGEITTAAPRPAPAPRPWQRNPELKDFWPHRLAVVHESLHVIATYYFGCHVEMLLITGDELEGYTLVTTPSVAAGVAARAVIAAIGVRFNEMAKLPPGQVADDLAVVIDCQAQYRAMTGEPMPDAFAAANDLLKEVWMHEVSIRFAALIQPGRKYTRGQVEELLAEVAEDLESEYAARGQTIRID